MILFVIIFLPLLAASIVLTLRNPSSATRFASLAGVVEVVAVAAAVWRIHAKGTLSLAGYLRADSLTAFFLINIGLVFFVVLLYSAGYIRHVPAGRFSSPRWFYFLLFLFLFTIMGVYLASNLGLLWIMMEGTTLASALLVGFYNTEGAVEAGWKYLIVCTVGLAFALFGTIVFYIAAVRGGMTPETALQWPALLQAATTLSGSHALIKLAFIFLVVGYGTKIGLVPMHSWLPDAHAEAPSPVSAMLSAGLLNCAVYALVRYQAIVTRSLGAEFGNHLLLFFGASSLAVAALLMIVQQDLKRLLAYSSVEHMGIIATGLGLGGFFGLYGALLHTLNHSMAKSLLFFSAGRVRESVGTSRLSSLHALARRLPWVSAGLVIGLIAILGLPPFGLFISEFAILREAFGQSQWLPGLVLLAALIIVFGAMTYHFLKALMGGPPSDAVATVAVEGSRTEFAAMGICAGALVLFGFTIPGPFMHLLRAAMAVLQ